MLNLTKNGLLIYDILFLKSMNLNKNLKLEIENTISFQDKKLISSYYSKSNHRIISPGFIYYLLDINEINNNFKSKYIFNKKKILNRKIIINYKLTLYQNIIMKSIKDKFKELNERKLPLYLTIIAPCGFGKTILAIDLIVSKNYNKTFIVTPTFILAENFKSKIEEFTNLRCHISKNGAKTFLDKEYNKYEFDILIIPNKHLSNFEFCIYLHNNFSLGIFDECHLNNLQNKVSLTHFLNNFTFDSLLFITATERLENRHSMGLSINISEYINRSQYQNFHLYFKILTYNKNIKNFEDSDVYKLYRKNAKNEKGIRCKQKCFAEDYNRHKLIIKNILEDYNNNEECKMLILTLIDKEIFIYLDYLKEYNIDIFPIISGNKYYNIKLKNDNYESSFFLRNYDKIKNNYFNKNECINYIKNKKKFIILGNYDNIGYGVDIVSLNYLHFTNLTKNKIIIQQSIGRISRNNNNNKHYARFYIGTPSKYINVDDYKNKIISYLKEIDSINEEDLIKI